MNNRKHIRVPFNDDVRFEMDGRTTFGKSIDICQKGIRVVANFSGYFNDIKRVSFSLPTQYMHLNIPCNVVWVKKKCENNEYLMGLEFSGSTTDQALHLGRYIKQSEEHRIEEGSSVNEMRQIPRSICFLKDIKCDNEDITIISIDNISTEGFLMSFKGDLNKNDNIELEFFLPGDSRKLTADGSVVYVIEDFTNNTKSAGVIFSKITDINRIRISNFILEMSSISALKSLHENISINDLNREYQIDESAKIFKILTLLKDETINLYLVLDKSSKIFKLQIRSLNYGDNYFKTLSYENHVDVDLREHYPAFFSFNLNDGSYYFKSELLNFTSDSMMFAIPCIIYQSEKRSYRRKTMDNEVELTLGLDEKRLQGLQGRLIDISRFGFLCEVPYDKSIEEYLKNGSIINYSIDIDFGLGSEGEVRHLAVDYDEDGGRVFRIGVEAGIQRSHYKFKKYNIKDWTNKKVQQRKLPGSFKEKNLSRVIRYKNREDKEITAMVNYTGKPESAPVVILPPAFGKKKEALSPLVSTLLTSFRYYNKDLVTVRYDGINRPGESSNDDMCPKRGYEMLHYRISQGYNDLETTLNYVYDNPMFKPSNVVLVAFSMSSMDARKLLANSNDNRIHYLINVMGVTSGQSAFSNITGGLDIIGNYRIGVKNRISGVLGYLLNLDNIAKDLIESKYAYLTDARYDMSKISIPISWIYGKYDKWISTEEIEDIMSIKSAGLRELIEVPTGHNMRSSEDAVKTFKLITGLIYDFLHKKKIKPLDPDHQKMVSLIISERERLENAERFLPEEYWKEYLLGRDRNSPGYDFYENIQEFRDFLNEETGLIDLKDGEIMADMGCGTGLFFECLLRDSILKEKNLGSASIILVDLVQGALDKARLKFENLFKEHSNILPHKIEFIKMDLEPNRFIPLKTFIDEPDLDFNYLRNRIEGLKNLTIDNLLKNSSARLYEIIRGDTFTDSDMLILKNNFSYYDNRIIAELNLASRFLKNRLTSWDIKNKDGQTCKQGGLDNKDLKASDLKFERLNFSDSGSSLRLNFPDDSFDKITASLLISYLYNPGGILKEFYRMLKPGGVLLVSSMRPDSDISVIFSNYIQDISKRKENLGDKKFPDDNINAAREMLNDVAELFQLEEEGNFRFYSQDELVKMLEQAGFKIIDARLSLGNPEQAVIVKGERPL